MLDSRGCRRKKGTKLFLNGSSYNPHDKINARTPESWVRIPVEARILAHVYLRCTALCVCVYSPCDGQTPPPQRTIPAFSWRERWKSNWDTAGSRDETTNRTERNTDVTTAQLRRFVAFFKTQFQSLLIKMKLNNDNWKRVKVKHDEITAIFISKIVMTRKNFTSSRSYIPMSIHCIYDTQVLSESCPRNFVLTVVLNPVYF